MQCKLLIVTLLLSISLASYAQNRAIEGTVLSGDDQSPMPGVNVVIKGTTNGTATDADGKYRIDVADETAVLQFSFVGYKTQEITVGTQTSINVTLESDAETLGEVVVVGYGTVRKSDLTGSVASVKSEDLVKMPFASPTQALQGRIPGVQVVSNSGAPGDGSSVRIRGVSSTGNSNPLFIVDGVFLTNMDFLNSNDIQSIEVLKDASATAIYGSRGANGVIIVTTKKGKLGQEAPTISFSTDYSIQHLSQRIDVLTGRQFAQVVNDITPGTYNNIDAVANTNWQDQIFRDAAIQNYQLSISGSSSKTQYYFGMGYYKQEGIIPKSDYERLTIKLNNTYHLAKWLRLGNNITLAPSKRQNAFGGAVFNAYRSQPVLTPYQSNGAYTPVPGVGNVLADIEYTNSFSRDLAGVGNFFLEADILKGLTFKSSMGIDGAYSKGRGFTPVFSVSPLQQNAINDLNKNWNDRFVWIWENTVNLDREFGKHRINAVIGYTAQEGTSETMTVSGQNIIRDDPSFWYLNPSNIVGTSVNNQTDFDVNYSIISYLARANYSYDNRYLATVTFRRDGSSKFNPSHRWGNFPAFALGWNVINESFLQNNETLSNLKVRASWGIVGNAGIPYDRQYSRVLNGQNAVFGSAENLYPGATYGVSGNPDLRWEEFYQTDIGVEIGFMNDAFTAEIDYFEKKTKDILIDLAVPGYLGNGDGALITYNTGRVLNRGVEFNLNYNGKAGAFEYRVGVNGTTIHNEMLNITGTGGPNDYIQNGDGTTRTKVGDPIGSFFGYKTIGVFQNQGDLDSYPHRSDAGIGDLKFEDTDKNGVLDANDRVNLGSYIPKFYYGLNAEVTWKGITLAADFQGTQGNKILNYKETVRPDLYNFEAHVFNRWRGEGTSNTEPRATSGGYNWLVSDRFIQDGSFIRLRSLNISYGLPTAWLDQVSLKQARVFLRGTNLVTWKKNTGYSPEVNASNPLDAGIDRGAYPIPSVYTVGVNVTF